MRGNRLHCPGLEFSHPDSSAQELGRRLSLPNWSPGGDTVLAEAPENEKSLNNPGPSTAGQQVYTLLTCCKTTKPKPRLRSLYNNRGPVHKIPALKGWRGHSPACTLLQFESPWGMSPGASYPTG